jgi:hypothetical protein
MTNALINFLQNLSPRNPAVAVRTSVGETEKYTSDEFASALNFRRFSYREDFGVLPTTVWTNNAGTGVIGSLAGTLNGRVNISTPAVINSNGVYCSPSSTATLFSIPTTAVFHMFYQNDSTRVIEYGMGNAIPTAGNLSVTNGSFVTTPTSGSAGINQGFWFISDTALTPNWWIVLATSGIFRSFNTGIAAAGSNAYELLASWNNSGQIVFTINGAIAWSTTLGALSGVPISALVTTFCKTATATATELDAFMMYRPRA